MKDTQKLETFGKIVKKISVDIQQVEGDREVHIESN